MHANIKYLNNYQSNSQNHYITAQFIRPQKQKRISNTRQQTQTIKHMSNVLSESSQFSFSNNNHNINHFNPHNNNRMILSKQKQKQKQRDGGQSSGKLTIREDLCKLSHDDLIQIIMQEIQQNKLLRIKITNLQDQCKIIASFRDDSVNLDSLDQSNSQNMTKYKQLAQYMQQYIMNTNQAQNYFTGLINNLKDQNKQIKQQNMQYLYQINQLKKNNNNKQQEKHINLQVIKQYEETIKNLQDSVSHYIQINNQCTKKYEKLKKMHEHLQQQLSVALDEQKQQVKRNNQILCDTKKLNNAYFSKENKEKLKNNISQKDNEKEQDYIERIKILQIQNNQLKQSSFALQKALEKKSQKIRKLLQQMQKLSEQKWQYKQKYMEIKSKSFFKDTQSSSKNSEFDSMRNQVNIKDFQH